MSSDFWGLAPKFASEILVGAPNFSNKNICAKYPKFCPMNFRYGPKIGTFSQLLRLVGTELPKFFLLFSELGQTLPQILPPNLMWGPSTSDLLIWKYPPPGGIILLGSCVGSYKIQDPIGSWWDFLPGRYLLHLMMIQNLPLGLKQIWNFLIGLALMFLMRKEITIASKLVKTKKRGEVTWIYSLSCGLNHISRTRKHILLLLLSLRTEVKQGPMVFIGFGIHLQEN